MLSKLANTPKPYLLRALRLFRSPNPNTHAYLKVPLKTL